ncbi:MAG TPA: xanthine dehydrogenase family protein subunit M [Anaerolineaceae bacterium]|nr:xanthine dehydrogenase family protein subunit M [Anaerolineaceae bacterium]
MKPAPFEYYAPTSIPEALDRLDQLGYDGKVLAGGQSLIPAMNFRMARPAALVDLNNVPELFYIIPAPQGGYLIGTMTRDVSVETHPEISKKYHALNQAFHTWAHPQIRNRGTYGGALAHADPAGQLPGVSLALEFRMKITGKATGERWVDAKDFFVGPFTTVIEPSEMLTEVYMPDLGPRTGTSYQQVARTHGSQFQVAVAVKLVLDANERCQKANIAMLAVGEQPILAEQAARLLAGQALSDQNIEAAARLVATKEIDPGTDIHATAEYRRHATEVLVRRALNDAKADAKQRGG